MKDHHSHHPNHHQGQQDPWQSCQMHQKVVCNHHELPMAQEMEMSAVHDPGNLYDTQMQSLKLHQWLDGVFFPRGHSAAGVSVPDCQATAGASWPYIGESLPAAGFSPPGASAGIQSPIPQEMVMYSPPLHWWSCHMQPGWGGSSH